MATNAASGRATVTRTLRGRDCAEDCPGDIVEGQYKGTTALLCDECGTPAARFW